MIKKSVVIVIFLFVILSQCNENKEDNNVFVPTKEWQIVRKGQKIPKGLHVRINLETGQTEAKLLDDSVPDVTKALSALSADTQPIDNNPIPKSRLEEAVKNIKPDDSLDPAEIKKIKDKFRSYDEIKKSLSELNLTPKIDAEVIADLLQRHKELIAKEKLDKLELLRVLEDLDFLAHQYDNAREFVNQNGFNEIIYKNVNLTNVDVKKETLRLMASLVQNNAGPKIHAVETGAIGVLLRLLNFEGDAEVKGRALTALSALLRSFPLAQRKFIENGGLTVLAKFFDSDDVKIQVRTATLISDLIIEHDFASLDEKTSKFYTFDLTKRVLEADWCEHLNKLLFRLIITDTDDHDSMEKCLIAMQTLRTQCGQTFDRNVLTGLQKRYELLAVHDAKNDNSTFFPVLKNLCDEILHHVHKKNIKTEL